jgi:hypothetical protein
MTASSGDALAAGVVKQECGIGIVDIVVFGAANAGTA